MKSIGLSILIIICGFTFVVSEIWVIVSFILYLVKDEPFNWTVFWIGIVALIILIVSAIAQVFQKHSVSAKVADKTPSASPKVKSKFAQRLEEAQAKQNEKNRNRKNN